MNERKERNDLREGDLSFFTPAPILPARARGMAGH